MQNFNFLILSISYCRWIENSQTHIDYLRLSDEILRYLDSDFKLQEDITIAGIARSLKKNDSVKIGANRLASFLRMIELTVRWLKGTMDQKKTIEADLDAMKKGAYKRALEIGIKCMKKDSVTSWKYVVKLMRKREGGKNYREKIDSCCDPQALEELIQYDIGKFSRFYIRRMKRLKDDLERVGELRVLEKIVEALRNKNDTLIRHVRELSDDKDVLLRKVEIWKNKAEKRQCVLEN